MTEEELRALDLEMLTRLVARGSKQYGADDKDWDEYLEEMSLGGRPYRPR